MDLSELKKQADRSYDVALAKQNQFEKAKSRMLVAHDGHLFKADPETINLVGHLKSHSDTFVVLDANGNPAMIKDPESFLRELISKNQEVLNSYHQAYQEFTRLR